MNPEQHKRLAPFRAERLQRAKDDIKARLRRSCGGVPEAEFDALAERMASIEIKYAQRGEAFELLQVAAPY